MEERVITKERALEAINGVVELLQESDEIGQGRSTRCSAVQLIEAIACTFALKGPARQSASSSRKALGDVRMPFAGYRPDYRIGIELAAIDAHRAAEAAADIKCRLDEGIASVVS
jgi:hypothetical protein